MDVALLVASTFKTLFPDIEIKREKSSDGSFTTPSFFVHERDTNVTFKPSSEQMRKYRFDVIYFADSDDEPTAEIAMVKSKLLDHLDYLLDADEKPVVKVQELSTTKIEDDLHIMFSVMYRMGAEAGPMFERHQLESKEVFKNGD